MRASPSRPNRSAAAPRLVLALLLSAASFFQNAAAQTGEAAILAVYVNGVRHGDRETVLAGDEVRLPLELLPEAFRPLLDDAGYTLVENAAAADGFIDTADLRALGFGVELDREALSLRLRAPARLMALGYLGTSRARPALRAPAVDPAAFSGFANASLRAEQNVGEGFDPYLTLSGSLDAAANLFGWVAESSGEAEVSPIGSGGSARAEADLGYARVVRDFRGIASRLTVGTGDLPWRGLQSRTEVLGVSLVRNEWAAYPPEPSRAPRRTVGESFSVETSARVAVRLNGETVFSGRVPAGRYRFSDLPFASGLNEVEIEIAEDGAPPARYRLGVPFDSGALRAGEFDFGIGAGLGGGDYSSPAFSGFVARGLSDALALGLSSQAGFGVWEGGLELSAATALGLLGLEGAASLGDGFGWALGASYRLSLAHRRYFPRLGLRGLWRSPGFSPPVREPSARESAQWSVSLQAAQATPAGLSFSLSGEYGSDGASADADFLCSLGVTAPLGRGATLQSSATLHDRDERLEPSLSLTLIVVPEKAAGPFLFRQELVSGEANLDLSLTRGKGPGSVSYSFGAENLVGPEGRPSYVSGAFRRTGSLADAYASVGVRDERSADGTSVSFGAGVDAAFVFADGIFSMTRRVSDSFALLAPDRSLASADVELRLGTERTAVRPGGRPKVAGQLSAYRESVAEIDTPGSPPELAVRESRVLLRPGYRSAVVVRPERAASAYVSGRLLDGSGAPRVWLSGTVEDAAGKTVAELFTDETGAFEAYELAEGRYVIRWRSPDAGTAEFEIPPNAYGGVDLGEIGGSE